MGGSEHAPLQFTGGGGKRSLEKQLRFGVLVLAEQGNGQIARICKCIWMLGSQRALF